MTGSRHSESFPATQLRRRRERAGLTQDELARRAEVKVDTLRAIEQGRTLNPGIMTVLRLADVLAVSLDELVRSEPRHPSGGLSS